MSCIELFFELSDRGVPKPEPCRGGSLFCLSRFERLNRSPKLFRPVDVEVRVEAIVVVGRLSSLGMLRRELSVEDRPRSPSLLDGDDLLEAVEGCRASGAPGTAANDREVRRSAPCEGDGRGVLLPSTDSGGGGIRRRRAATAGESTPAEVLVASAGTASEAPLSEFVVFCGSGNSSVFCFFRLAKRKNVVVVCTVCVVVV